MDRQSWLINLRYWWLRRHLADEAGSSGTQQYCPRFGQLAVEFGFVSPTQVRQALLEQWDDQRAGRPHRVLGAIFFAHNWMTPGEIDRVLNELFRRRQAQEQHRLTRPGYPLPSQPNL